MQRQTWVLTGIGMLAGCAIGGADGPLPGTADTGTGEAISTDAGQPVTLQTMPRDFCGETGTFASPASLLEWYAVSIQAEQSMQVTSIQYGLMHFMTENGGCLASHAHGVRVWTQRRSDPRPDPRDRWVSFDQPERDLGTPPDVPSDADLLELDLTEHNLELEAGDHVVVAIEQTGQWVDKGGESKLPRTLCVMSCRNGGLNSWDSNRQAPPFAWVPLSFGNDLDIEVRGVTLPETP